jgi:hypothetical protein
MSWTQLAEQLDDTGELAARAAACQAAAWSAGLDPEVMRGITGAALALGARPADLTGRAAPWPTDAAMIAAAEELAADVARRLAAAEQLARQVRAAIGQAHAVLAAATNTETARAAMAAIADCEAALEILSPLALRLGYARARLAEVPADLAQTYAAANRHVAVGGALPYEGRWLTGARR